MEAGRKGWLQQGLENGVNLEAFALFSLCVCLREHTCRHIPVACV